MRQCKKELVPTNFSCLSNWYWKVVAALKFQGKALDKVCSISVCSQQKYLWSGLTVGLTGWILSFSFHSLKTCFCQSQGSVSVKMKSCCQSFISVSVKNALLQLKWHLLGLFPSPTWKQSKRSPQGFKKSVLCQIIHEIVWWLKLLPLVFWLFPFTLFFLMSETLNNNDWRKKRKEGEWSP